MSSRLRSTACIFVVLNPTGAFGGGAAATIQKYRSGGDSGGNNGQDGQGVPDSLDRLGSLGNLDPGLNDSPAADHMTGSGPRERLPGGTQGHLSEVPLALLLFHRPRLVVVDHPAL